MMYKQSTKLLSILIILALFSSLSAQEIQLELQQKIQASVDQYVSDRGFSGTILLADQGEIIYQQAYGEADRSSQRKIQGNEPFAIASVTKMLTAIRVLQLVEQNKIQLDESINTYLSTWSKEISKKVTIHNLLLHTSGLANEDDRTYWQQLSAAEIVSRSLKQKGKGRIGRFNYNNVDYLLLGLLIEQVTGQSWEDEIRTHILQPCEMTSSGFLAFENYPPEFVQTYTFKERGKVVADPTYYIGNFHAAGNMYANATDLLKLDQALYGTSLLSEESKKLLAISYPDLGYAGYGVWNYRYPFIDAQPQIMERRGGY